MLMWVVLINIKTLRLQDIDKTVSIHTRNLQILGTEIFTMKPAPFFFQINDFDHYNLMKDKDVKSSNPITGCYRTETILVSRQKL